MSDVQGHMLRHYQLFNSQLGLGLPQGITHPKPLATGLGGEGNSLEPG